MDKYSLLLLVFFIAACSNNNNNKEPVILEPELIKESSSSEESSSSVIQEPEFIPEMLGLTPGSTTAEVNFAWYSDSGEKSLVRVFENSKLIAVERGIYGLASEGKYFHKATAKNLKPNTVYTYQISNDSREWSPEYRYKTPQIETFKFAAIADPQLTIYKQTIASQWFSSDSSVVEGWKTTIEKIEAAKADFILSLGDQVNESANENEYEFFFAPPALRNIPFAPTVGNHDRHYIFQYHFNLPNEQNFSEDNYGNYFYLYNNILFVGLNTSAWPGSMAEAIPYIEDFDITLTAAKTKFNGKYKWLIVQHHKSTRSVANHLADPDIQYYMAAGFEKLMEKHNVDFVLAGHDHVYARTYLNNIYYMTFTTASGIKYYDLLYGMPLLTDKYFQNKIPSYTIFEVSGNSISVSVYEVDKDAPIDKFEVVK